MSRRFGGRILAAGLIAAAVAAATITGGAAAPTKKGKPNLDDLTFRVEEERRQDGSLQRMRSFRRAIPWEEYLAALAAEPRLDALGTPIEEAVEAGAGESMALAADTLAACVPPDADYDGDGFTLTTSPADVFPLRPGGEYRPDRPRLVARFTSYIEPGIEVLYSGSTTTTFEYERFLESDLQEKTAVKETREFKKKFNGSFGLKLGFSGGKFSTSLDLGLGGETERSKTYSWSREKTRSMEEKFTEIRRRKSENTVSFGPAAGRVTGQVTIYNLSDYALDMDVSNVRIAVVAYSPFTGAKYALGDILLGGPYTIYWGQGQNFASAFVELRNLNTLDTMNRLAEGWVFDMEMAGVPLAIDRATGANVGAIISQANQRNSRLSIHYGDATDRAFGQVAVFQPASACLTPKDMLAAYVGASNVEFDRLPDGRLIVKRIHHRTNQLADRDFDTLTPAEQAQYGKWVIGFDYYTNPDTGFDLETTLLGPEDKVFFYYLTAADFQEEAPPADRTLALGIANDGSSPATQLVTPVSVYDTVELYVKTRFTIESAYSQSAGNVGTSCGNLYGATYFGRRVTTDSTLHTINVPNVDWYGLQVDFGGQGYRSLASLMADPAANAQVTSFRGFPDYDYVVKFLVTPAMLGAYPTRNLFVKSANARQTFSVGYEGYNVLGQRVVCRFNQSGGYYRNTGSLKVWDKLDNVDGDLDRFYAASSTGIDFDDAHARRFPYAPEHLDGMDNDGDGVADDSPMICPEGLRSGDAGTCSLDNRLSWYPAAPNTLIERRFRRADGTTTAWETIGSGLTSWAFTMTQDLSFTSMEVRTTYYPSGGGAFAGTNLVTHLPGAEVPVFPAGQDVEAESGRIVAPMRIDSAGGDTFVHVPKNTPATAPALAEYRFSVSQTGDYALWTRVYATNSGDDSFLVTLMDPSGQPFNFGYGSVAHFRLEIANPAYGYGAFNWTRADHWNPYVSPEERMVPIFYRLTPGTWTVRIQPRELGTRLDRLRLERYCPDADLDGWTTCAGDCNDANPNIRPGRGEVCTNTLDDDCDGYVNEGCGGGCRPPKCIIYEEPAAY